MRLKFSPVISSYRPITVPIADDDSACLIGSVKDAGADMLLCVLETEIRDEDRCQHVVIAMVQDIDQATVFPSRSSFRETRR